MALVRETNQAMRAAMARQDQLVRGSLGQVSLLLGIAMVEGGIVKKAKKTTRFERWDAS